MTSFQSSSEQQGVNQPSLAIGGVGGSGTRVFADIARSAGYYIGSNLNDSLDNLWFTVLLKQKSWISQFPTQQEIDFALNTFFSVMNINGGLATLSELTQKQIDYLKSLPTSEVYSDDEKRHFTAVVESIFDNSVKDEKLNDLELLGSLSNGAVSNESLASGSASTGQALAWKEPNTHIFLPSIHKANPNIKFIQIIRDGFYMAYNKNQNQIRQWGKIFDLEFNPRKLTAPVCLDYWIKSNTRTIDYGITNMGANFYLLNYDRFCQNVPEELEKLLQFIGRGITSQQFEEYCNSVRHKTNPDIDIAVFSDHQVAAVQALNNRQTN